MNDTFLEKMISEACSEIAEEDVAEFDSVDSTDVTVSEESKKRFDKELDKAFVKESRTIWYLKRIAVAVAVILALLYIVVAAIEPLRKYFWKYQEQRSANCVKVELETVAEEGFEYPRIVLEVKMPKVKDTWKVEPMEPDVEDPDAFIITTDDGKEIYYSITTVYGDWFMDNSKHTVEEVYLSNGEKAVVIIYEHGSTILIFQNEYKYKFISHEVKKDVLIELAGTIE